MDKSQLRRREGRIGPLGYYWFLTFEHAPEFHAHVKDCQQSIDTAYFDLTAAEGLHLTVDRIAYDGELSRGQLHSIAAAAGHACQHQPPFVLELENFTNLHGAIGFIASRHERVHALRDELRTATRSIYPDASVKDSASKPHVTVAYPVFEGLSAIAAATAQKIGTTVDAVDVTITEAVMVALERHPHSYEWDVISRIPLGG
ncbi:hypothetical protein DFR70_113156 [Nocardia tenerifensis]|uniref:2'-5' RNA ligase superfamily protein n=1 Tax=Nocardia tenerifensis TaxID=228006 RepID=A0A318JUC2_9NOCA|nr:2'-5' RNA ligase family protein [Nocardia tenerifensis]PXX58821.1 hypothetical protein DFR70_113156 [Nocardia tenerifensis]